MTEHLCPLSGKPLLTPPITAKGVYLVYSPRAGGVYGLNGSAGAGRSREVVVPLIHSAKPRPRQQANLSHWIYCQNRDAGLLWPT